MYEIQLFGPLEVRTRGVRLSGRDFGGVMPRHILALLALRGEMRGAELPELLWSGNPPAGHRAIVEGQVSLLRHRLDPTTTHARDSVITAGDGGYALAPDRVRVDVARFDELVAVAAGRVGSSALRPLTAAAHLAARPLLADLEDAAWLARAREQYGERVAAVRLALSEVDRRDPIAA